MEEEKPAEEFMEEEKPAEEFEALVLWISDPRTTKGRMGIYDKVVAMFLVTKGLHGACIRKKKNPKNKGMRQ